MARILIGNIKGPKGDTGAQGPRGETGPQGPQGPLPPLVNNALATEAGVSALDAVMGKTLQDQITNNKNDITQLNSNIESHFPDNGNIQTGPVGNYPRVALIQNGSLLHVRLQLDTNTYHEIVIGENGITASRMQNGEPESKSIVTF